MIQPNGNRVLVKRIEQAKPDSQLIVIPETIQDKPSVFGVVLAIGSKVREEIAIADMVILQDFVGARVYTVLPGDEEETECIIVNEDEILAVVEGV